MKAVKGLILAGTASHNGKTSAALGLICALKKLGIPVLAAKCGPDFIDASWLYWASGQPVPNIDIHMSDQAGTERLVERMERQLAPNGLLVMEGVMGLYDGDRHGRGSTAEIAVRLKLPLLLLLNVKGMGQSLCALAEGFLNYQPSWQSETGKPRFLGLICTHTGSPAHAALCEEILQPVLSKYGIRFFGCLSSRDAPAIPSRHLGLVSANEVSLEKEELAHWFMSQINVNWLLKSLDYEYVIHEQENPLPGKGHEFFNPDVSHDNGKIEIAIAKDEAFSFIYADLPALLMELGARVRFFSPLHDEVLPECSGIYIPGGYPELYAERLSANLPIMRALACKAAKGAPIYGECGGFIYLGNSLKDENGVSWEMCKLLPVSFEMNNRLQGLGYRSVRLLVKNNPNLECQGHEFHYAKISDSTEIYEPLWKYAKTGMANGKEGCRVNNVFGSWTHLYPEGSRAFWKYWLALCASSQT